MAFAMVAFKERGWVMKIKDLFSLFRWSQEADYGGDFRGEGSAKVKGGAIRRSHRGRKRRKGSIFGTEEECHIKDTNVW